MTTQKVYKKKFIHQVHYWCNSYLHYIPFDVSAAANCEQWHMTAPPSFLSLVGQHQIEGSFHGRQYEMKCFVCCKTHLEFLRNNLKAHKEIIFAAKLTSLKQWMWDEKEGQPMHIFCSTFWIKCVGIHYVTSFRSRVVSRFVPHLVIQ